LRFKFALALAESKLVGVFPKDKDNCSAPEQGRLPKKDGQSMKRSLVIGCAAIALAAGCGTASAQSKSKFDIVVGGDAFFQAGYVDQDVDAGLRKTEFSNRLRLRITPTAKADNGLEYGARLRIRAAGPGNTVTADRAYIFANGTFGSVQAGTINGLSDEYGVIGPNVDGISGSPDGFWATFYNGALPYVMGSLRTLESGDNGTKLVYLTPVFSGFQLGGAYTPKYGNVNTSIDRRKGSTTYADMGEVQAYYKGAVGPVGLEGSVAYQFADADVSATKNLSSIHAGLNVSYGSLVVGGSYANSGKSGYSTRATGIANQQVWIVGAQYTIGPVILAGTYTDGRGISSAGGTTSAANARAHLYQAGVTYTIAPGLTTGLEYSFVDNKVGTVNNDANIVLVDTRLAF
jgi:outer membrane protein OmpU